MDADLLKKVIQKIVREEIQQSLTPAVTKIIKESVKEEIKNILFEQFTSGNANLLNNTKQQPKSNPFSLQELMSEDEAPQQQYNYAPQPQIPPQKPINTGNMALNNILNEMKVNGYEHIPSEYSASPIVDYANSMNMGAMYAAASGITPNTQTFNGVAGQGYLQAPDPNEVMISPHKKPSLPPGLAQAQAQAKVNKVVNRDYSELLNRLK